MKKFKTMMAMMLALVSMCVAFSSCSSDDDDNNGAGSSATAEQVVGTYVGETMSITSEFGLR
jgi:ABC-type glycerol-3-phosphate transport system substrate-binding protein